MSGNLEKRERTWIHYFDVLTKCYFCTASK